ncbi:hypothetical protein [Reichenbachiella sp. MSK19-1]|uniref:hypothetical protein n=1 Tax=Reichenbachiella sp. MSK19-1 TaxID=1897631 RepID=UPI000E6BE45E|nr:hypothetical protein [Reichenbachiella sp. MSK19-1]RJE71575.1 hypothetical protein BGP76_05635 [Reichenbachiella sp. MSK19-1]
MGDHEFLEDDGAFLEDDYEFWMDDRAFWMVDGGVLVDDNAFLGMTNGAGRSDMGTGVLRVTVLAEYKIKE